MSIRRFKVWSSDDESVLRLMFEAGATWCDIGVALDRPANACEVRANTMGLFSTRSMPRPWTDAEIAAVYKGWQSGLSDIAIGKQLGRSTKSVMRKRVSLGFVREPGDPRGVDRVQNRSASAQAAFDAKAGWPHPSAAERKRGEALLDMAFGGVPKRDNRPVNSMQLTRMIGSGPLSASSAAWAVA